MVDFLEHPDVKHAIETGYPRSWDLAVNGYSHAARSNSISCERCGCELIDEEVYEDETYDFLCEDCLLRLHNKID